MDSITIHNLKFQINYFKVFIEKETKISLYVKNCSTKKLNTLKN